jgi:hypothetical protein
MAQQAAIDAVDLSRMVMADGTDETESATTWQMNLEIVRITRLKFTGTDEEKWAFLIALGWEMCGGTWHHRRDDSRFHVEWRPIDLAFDCELRYLITGKV